MPLDLADSLRRGGQQVGRLAALVHYSSRIRRWIPRIYRFGDMVQYFGRAAEVAPAPKDPLGSLSG